jgi:hypothetical protein
LCGFLLFITVKKAWRSRLCVGSEENSIMPTRSWMLQLYHPSICESLEALVSMVPWNKTVWIAQPRIHGKAAGDDCGRQRPASDSVPWTLPTYIFALSYRLAYFFETLINTRGLLNTVTSSRAGDENLSVCLSVCLSVPNTSTGDPLSGFDFQKLC